MINVLFNEKWRRRKYWEYRILKNSTARQILRFLLSGQKIQIYSNSNLSIYSGQKCNAKCPFCVEELRPLSRGIELSQQKTVLKDNDKYFNLLNSTLDSLDSLKLSVSITGGEPSLDYRTPRILQILQSKNIRKRTMTTNGSGLLESFEGRTMIEWITVTGVHHLNISRAHHETEKCNKIMNYNKSLTLGQLKDVIRSTKKEGTRVRLSCILCADGVNDINGIVEYLSFAEEIGVDNVVFRQLMGADLNTQISGDVALYNSKKKIMLEPLLDIISRNKEFEFIKQVIGYYYYVEIWKWHAVDVVFEEASLLHLEETKRSMPDTIHEFIFHPNGILATTWQPWDGIINLNLFEPYEEETKS